MAALPGASVKSLPAALRKPGAADLTEPVNDPALAFVTSQLFRPVIAPAPVFSTRVGRVVPKMRLLETSALMLVPSALERCTKAALPPFPTNVLLMRRRDIASLATPESL